MLQAIDQHWREHLAALDYLRQGIHLRGYAQKNPKQEYKREAFELFGLMQARIRNDVTRVLMTVRIQSPEEVEQVERSSGRHVVRQRQLHARRLRPGRRGCRGRRRRVDRTGRAAGPGRRSGSRQQPVRRFGDKIGRNDPCPCGSGKKYKQCHGRLA
jgi:preprotein translocase subunit SecA